MLAIKPVVFGVVVIRRLMGAGLPGMTLLYAIAWHTIHPKAIFLTRRNTQQRCNRRENTQNVHRVMRRRYRNRERCAIYIDHMSTRSPQRDEADPAPSRQFLGSFTLVSPLICATVVTTKRLVEACGLCYGVFLPTFFSKNSLITISAFFCL